VWGNQDECRARVLLEAFLSEFALGVLRCQ
jgi:hypothetical protein